VHDLTNATWRTSRFSGSGNACIEVADLHNNHHALRDSKDPTGPALILTTAEWVTFTTEIHAGKFD
jgi:Domain of unknown function (DUF397)